MEQRLFGNNRHKVPVVGMGTWETFDVHGRAAEAHCRSIVDVALSSGATLFDSSPMYGEAERVLGLTLEGRRDSTTVATKIWTHHGAEARAQIDRALGFFGGRVDIYQIHNLVAWREHLPVLEELREQGKVKLIGITHYSRNAFPEMLEIMRSGRIHAIQIPYNAIEQDVEQEILPAAQTYGLGVIIMRPLGGGELMHRPPEAAALEPLERFGVRSWAQALLKWCLSDPRVHCVIPATSHIERMQENAAAGDPPWLDADARRYVLDLATRSRGRKTGG